MSPIVAAAIEIGFAIYAGCSVARHRNGDCALSRAIVVLGVSVVVVTAAQFAISAAG